jgi:hypothetical protein
VAEITSLRLMEISILAELSELCSQGLEVWRTSISDVLTIANMTGICQTANLEQLQLLVFEELTNSSSPPGEGIPIFGKSLISAVNNSRLLHVSLYSVGIEYFEDNTAFAPVAANYLKTLSLQNNRLRNIPVGLFNIRNLLNLTIKIYLSGNNSFVRFYTLKEIN